MQGINHISGLKILKKVEYFMSLDSFCACPGEYSTPGLIPTKPCNQIDSCSCKVCETGQIISLCELDNLSTPFKVFATDGYVYFYNPCSGTQIEGTMCWSVMITLQETCILPMTALLYWEVSVQHSGIVISLCIIMVEIQPLIMMCSLFAIPMLLYQNLWWLNIFHPTTNSILLLVWHAFTEFLIFVLYSYISDNHCIEFYS